MATFNDSFDYPDGSLDGQGGWATIGGTTPHNVANTQAVSQPAGTFLGTMQLTQQLDTGDHFVEGTANLNGTTGGEIGVWARIPLSGENGYFLSYGDFNSPGPLLQLYRVDGLGNYVELGQQAVSGTDAHVIRLEAEGTTLRGFFDGVELITATGQTLYQNNDRVGLEGFCNFSPVPSLDNLSAADLGGGNVLVHVGDTVPSAIRFGDLVVDAIHVGDTQVWP